MGCCDLAGHSEWRRRIAAPETQEVKGVGSMMEVWYEVQNKVGRQPSQGSVSAAPARPTEQL